MIEQLKNAIKTKRSLFETDIRKAIIQWKRRLYAASKEKRRTYST